MTAFYFRSTIIALPVLKLTNQNKRHYLFRFESVNQLVAFLTSVAPNCQRHSAKAGSYKKNAKIPQTFWVFGLNELRYIYPNPSSSHRVIFGKLRCKFPLEVKRNSECHYLSLIPCHFIRSPSRLRVFSVISVPDLALADRARVLKIQNSG